MDALRCYFGKEFSDIHNYSLPEALTDCYVFLMLFGFPLFTGFRGYRAITAGKFYWFAICTGLYISAWIIYSVLKPKKSFGISSAILMLLGYMLCCVISWMLSSYRGISFIGAGRYDGLITTLLYVSCATTLTHSSGLSEKHIRWFGCSITICCTVAVFQLFGFNPFGLFPEGVNYYDAHVLYSGEFLGTVGNSDELSSLLCVAVPLFGAYIITAEDNRNALWAVVPCFISALILFASQVSGGMLAVFVVTFFSAPLCAGSTKMLSRYTLVCALLSGAFAISRILPNCSENTHDIFLFVALGAFLLFIIIGATLRFVNCGLCEGKKPEKCFPRRPTLRSVVIVLMVLTAIFGLLLVYFYPGTTGTLAEISALLHGHIEDSYGSSRIRIWKNVLSLIPEHPLFGGGPGTVSERISVKFSRYVPETGKTLYSYVDNAHNEYLGILANTGIFSLIFYIGFIVCSVFHKKYTRERIILSASVICYSVQAFFGLGLCISAPIFWIFLGLINSNNKFTAIKKG